MADARKGRGIGEIAGARGNGVRNFGHRFVFHLVKYMLFLVREREQSIKHENHDDQCYGAFAQNLVKMQEMLAK